MSPSAFDLDRIRRETFVARIEHHATLGSTNDRAKELAASDAGELPLLVVADEQTAGRGRGSNRWWTGRGGLAFTLLLDGRTLGDERTSQPLAALAAAVAIVESVGQLADLPASRDCSDFHGSRRENGTVPFEPEGDRHIFRPVSGREMSQSPACERLLDDAPPRLGLRWPNDVYVGDRKLAGVLVEVLPDRRHVVGIGLNANNALAEAPPELRQTATTLLELAGRRHDPTALLISLLQHLARVFAQLAADAPAVGRRADALCLQRGQSLSLQLGSQSVAGRCLGIAPDGGLLLETPEGRRTFYAGTLLP